MRIIYNIFRSKKKGIKLMSKKDNTTKTTKKQYKHLTKDDRIKIETLINVLDENGNRLFSNSYIAKEIGVNRSTISRELRRIKSKINVISGKVTNIPYNASDAQDDYEFKRGLSKANYILDDYPKLREYIEDKIKNDKWAPDVISGYIESHKLYLQDGFTTISTTTIYRAIHYGLLKVKKEDTRRMIEFEKSGKYSSKGEIAENKRAYSIELRPDDINNRKTFGNWELDTVISTSKGQHKCLMTLTERKTRFEIIGILEAKTKEEVILKFKKIKNYLKSNLNEIIKSITTDNGSEFAGFKEIIEITNAQFYFCHPYASCEKATNEKHNGIIRYFIPKGKLIEDYTVTEINNVCNWMNDYPRKILNYFSPKEILQKELNNNDLYNKIINIQKAINA